MRATLNKFIHAEDGFALATTLGAILLVTAIGIASYFVARNSIEQAQTNSYSNYAFQTAASALEYELSRLQGGKELKNENGKTLPTGEKYDLKVTSEGIDLTVQTKAVKGGRTEIISRQLTIMNFSNTIYSGSGNLFKGPAFNSPQSMLIGQAYFKLDKGQMVNSSVQFIDGPLFVEGGRLQPKGGVQWKAVKLPRYTIHSTLPIEGIPASVEQKSMSVAMNPPVLTEAMISEFRTAAQSGGTYFSTDVTIGSPGDSFQPMHDGVFKSDKVIFSEGHLTIPESITAYEGNFVLFAMKGITVQGRLLPKDFAQNLSSPPAGSFEAEYKSALGEYIPRVRPNYCATLISPLSVNFNYSTGNNSETAFAFCGAAFSGEFINFKESLRGTFIGTTGLVPNKKTILAAQSDLSDSLPEIVKQLFNNVLAEGKWTRKSF